MSKPSGGPWRSRGRGTPARIAFAAAALAPLVFGCADPTEFEVEAGKTIGLASPDAFESPVPPRVGFRAAATSGSPHPTAVAAPVQTAPPADRRRNHIGMNLDGASDWMRPWMFVDSFKQARPWSLQERSRGVSSPGEKSNVDDRGHVLSLSPGQSAFTFMFTDSDGHYPGGRYVVRFDGSGELRWTGDARVASEALGMVLLDVTPRRGIRLVLVRTDPNDPIRNIRVYMPGFADPARAPLFHPEFIERLRPFAVLRFMDLQATNDSQLSRWLERPKTTDATQTTGKGVALEHLIELVKELDADPWFCMPHMADDDFVRQFATLVRDRLPKRRKVYVEHSNEVWNTIFEQARYARDRGLQLGLSRSEYQAQLRYHSQRSVEIFRIWEQVFGGTERLVRVLGSHAANPWVSETIMTWRDAHRHADALAVAPYFGQRFAVAALAPDVRKWSPEHLLGACHDEIETALERVETLAEMAGARGLELIAYEAGQHLAGRDGTQNDDALTELFVAANRHPGMKALYRRYLSGWYEHGGGLMMMFSFASRPGKWGSWGLLEWQDQPRQQAPKFDAVLDYLEGSDAKQTLRDSVVISES
jgi:hypothetical protein